MMLIRGEIIESNLEKNYIDSMYSECLETLKKSEQINTEQVIRACDALYQKAMQGELDEFLFPMLQRADISYEKFQAMAKLFSKKELEYKCRIELGNKSGSLETLRNGTKRVRYPLGILFHIAAGNVDGLPAYSVIEGLLTGNINILKLPAGDNGISVRLLYELVQCEPELKDYIYVFDVPSTESETLKQFAEMADAVVVWGGDEAVSAARSMVDINTKIISWGHKLSFAYVTEDASEEDLYQLARHICETEQRLCSSCQGIFFDTYEKEKLENFGQYFFELLQEANKELGKADIGMRGRNTIRLYNDILEHKKNQKILNKDGVSVVIKEDQELELSYMFRNAWIKSLPHEKIIDKIKKHKNHLQTCGLLCSSHEKSELSELLAKAGIVRITGSDMSRMIPGEAHDGIYPLQAYSRVVEIDC